MKNRVHLFEFEDMRWFPDVIRKGMTIYLRFILGDVLNYYKPVIPILVSLLDKMDCDTLIEIGAGGGGNAEKIKTGIDKVRQKRTHYLLSDLYPNLEAFSNIKKSSEGKIDFIEYPVNATSFPKDLKGLRVMFSSFHHFDPVAAKAILQDAVDNHEAIAIFDGGDKNLITILGITLVHPLVFLVCTPFFKPFRWTSLFFTYIVPLIPICTVWDGIVSIIRLYTPEQMLQLAENTNNEGYIWQSGILKNKVGMNVAYLTGHPAK